MLEQWHGKRYQPACSAIFPTYASCWIQDPSMKYIDSWDVQVCVQYTYPFAHAFVLAQSILYSRRIPTTFCVMKLRALLKKAGTTCRRRA